MCENIKMNANRLEDIKKQHHLCVIKKHLQYIGPHTEQKFKLSYVFFATKEGQWDEQ